MEWEDQASLCLALPSQTTTCFYKRFLRRFGWIHSEYFSSPLDLQSHVQNDTVCFIRTISENVVYSWNALAAMVREEFSGYFLREQTPEQNWKLYSSMVFLRAGTLQERRAAACALEKFQEQHAIKAFEVRLHEYIPDFRGVFEEFTKGRCVPASAVENWLDHISLERYNKKFEEAVRREYGYWPFAYGCRAFERCAINSFSRSFAHCTKAPFVYEGQSRAVLEDIYKSICELSAASRREHCLNVRLRLLQESGDSSDDLKKIRLVEAMKNQIGKPFGFQSEADWPRWLRDMGGIAKVGGDLGDHNKHSGLALPAFVGSPGQWDGEFASDDFDDEESHSDADGEDPEEFRGHSRAAVLKGVAPCFAQLPTAVLREMHSIAASNTDRERAVQSIMSLLPQEMVMDSCRHPMVFLGRVHLNCSLVLAYRSLCRRPPKSAKPSMDRMASPRTATDCEEGQVMDALACKQKSCEALVGVLAKLSFAAGFKSIFYSCPKHLPSPKRRKGVEPFNGTFGCTIRTVFGIMFRGYSTPHAFRIRYKSFAIPCVATFDNIPREAWALFA
eukprot:12406330-Karenia_brevis.AAC.2